MKVMCCGRAVTEHEHSPVRRIARYCCQSAPLSVGLSVPNHKFVVANAAAVTMINGKDVTDVKDIVVKVLGVFSIFRKVRTEKRKM